MWALVNGETMRVWADDWAGLGPLRSLIQGLLVLGEEELLVKNLFGPNETWIFDCISFLIPIHILLPLASFSRSTVPAFGDIPGWKDTIDGDFSCKTSYENILREEKTCTNPPMDLRWIWYNDMNHKVRHFLWLAAQERLPTKMLHILEDRFCHSCANLKNWWSKRFVVVQL